MKKNVKSRILILSVSSNQFGIGHYRRALSIAEFAKAEGCDVSHFNFVPERNSDLNNLIKRVEFGEGFEIVIIDLDPRFIQLQKLQILSVIKKLVTQAKIFIFDTATLEIKKNLGKQAQNIYFINPYEFENSEFEKNVLRGMKYMVFRNELQGVASLRGVSHLKSIVSISTGGSDPKGISWKFIKLLEKSQFEFDKLYIGIGQKFESTYISRIKKEILKSKILTSDIKFIKNDKFVSEILVTSKVILASGGLTKYELVKCGIPSIIMNMDEEQDSTTENLAKNGLLYNLGVYSNADFKVEKFSNMLSTLMNDELEYKKISQKALGYFKENPTNAFQEIFKEACK